MANGTLLDMTSGVRGYQNGGVVSDYPKQFTNVADYLQYLSKLTDISPGGHEAVSELYKVGGSPVIEYHTPQTLRDFMADRSGIEEYRTALFSPDALFFSGKEVDGDWAPDTIRYRTGIEGGKWEKRFPMHLRKLISESSHSIMEKYLGEMWMKGEEPSQQDINQIMSGEIQSSKNQSIIDAIEQSKLKETYDTYDDITKVEGFAHEWVQPLIEKYIKQQYGELYK